MSREPPKGQLSAWFIFLFQIAKWQLWRGVGPSALAGFTTLSFTAYPSPLITLSTHNIWIIRWSEIQRQMSHTDDIVGSIKLLKQLQHLHGKQRKWQLSHNTSEHKGTDRHVPSPGVGIYQFPRVICRLSSVERKSIFRDVCVKLNLNIVSKSNIMEGSVQIHLSMKETSKKEVK